MKSTANRTRPKVMNAGMVGLTECCNRGVLDSGAIMIVPLRLFKRSRIDSAFNLDRQP
jgi:hypothetical protein